MTAKPTNEQAHVTTDDAAKSSGRASTDARLVLHNYWRSSASYRVRIALGLKGLPYEYRAVHLLRDGGQQRSPAFQALNPMGQVPALEVIETDGRVHVLTQSLAILEYLEERWPDPALLPRDVHARAHARAIAEMINSGIQPLHNLSVTRRLKELGVDDAAWNQDFIRRGLAAVEQAICASPFALRATGVEEGSGGSFARFCVGNEPTIADCCLIPQLASARRFGVDTSGFPRLCEIEAHCTQLPAFIQAAPAVQPDAEPT